MVNETKQMIHNKPILVVEDNQVDILLIQNAFEELDIKNEIIIRNNGFEAIEYLRTLTRRDDYPGLILLDINMPRMNGIEFLNIIKSDDELKIIPVVVLTTSDNSKDKEESFKNSVAGYLVKPLEYFEFVELIKSLRSYWHNSKVAY